MRKENKWLGRITKTGLHLLYPGRCPVCDGVLPFFREKGAREPRKICRECERKLPLISGPVCMKCGKPVESIHQELCEDCGTFFHAFDAGRAAFTYTGVMRQSVFRIKYGGRREYLEYYGERMADLFEARVRRWEPEILIPVPMYWKKKNRRGFNQSEVLAGTLSKRWGIPVCTDALACCRDTAAQKSLGRKERRSNLKGAFRLLRSPLPWKTVLLIDDVYTTGSTLDEAAGLLREGGAENLYFLTLCTGKGKKAVCTEKNVWYT